MLPTSGDQNPAARSSGIRPELKSGPTIVGMPCWSVPYGWNASGFRNVEAIVTG
jgi:hypothetical protein